MLNKRKNNIKCNDLELESLLDSVGQKMAKLESSSSNKGSRNSSNFKYALKQRLLEQRHNRFSMKNIAVNLQNFFASKVFVASTVVVLIVAIVSTSSYFLQTTTPGQQLAQEYAVLSGFSELVIDSAYAQDFFELKPMDSDSLGVSASSGYILTSKEPVSTKLVKKYLSIKPLVDVNIKEITKTKWHITPKESLPENTIMQIALQTTSESGDKKEDYVYSWAYQITNQFKVINTIPAKSNGVPVRSGIEVTFSHDNFINYKDYFSITPAVKGSFEQHGRTMVFVPEESMEKGTIYTVKIKKGLPIKNSKQILLEDTTFKFETELNNNANNFFSLYQNMMEVSSSNKPILRLSTYDIPDNKLDVTLYKFSNIAEYEKILMADSSRPSWSATRNTINVQTNSLNKVASFEIPVFKQDYLSYLEFPETLPLGFYVAEITEFTDTKQMLIQVTDLSVYTSVTESDTIIWVNNLNSGLPAKDIKVTSLTNQESYKTDKDGIVKFPTYEDIKESSKFGSYDSNYYMKLSSDKDTTFVPLFNLTDYYFPSDGISEYWNYLYIDKPLYKPNDTIKFWGTLSDRKGEKTEGDFRVSLKKYGYLDHNFENIKIIDQSISLDDFNTYSGEFKLPDVKPDYYYLEISNGDKLIDSKTVRIEQYIKPAYNLSIESAKDASFLGKNNTYTVKANFFDGTPVPNLELIADLPVGSKVVKTDKNGKIKIDYTHKYSECTAEYGGCWPSRSSFDVRPLNSELGEISAYKSIRFYGAQRYIDYDVKYPAKGKVEIDINSKFIDLAAKELTNGHGGQKIAALTKIEGELIKITYTKEKVGSYYDFIDKKTYDTYSYDSNEQKLDSFTFKTDNNGNYVYGRDVEKDSSYRLDLKVYDSQGHYEAYALNLYYYDGNSISEYYNRGYSSYSLEVPDDKKYDIGNSLTAGFLKDQELVKSEKGRFLFMQNQEGLQEHLVTDNPSYTFTYEERDIPNINLKGVYFNGEVYIPTDTRLFSSGIVYDNELRNISIDIDLDKDNYKPGQEANLTITTKNKDNKPVEAAVNVNLIDEALYSLYDEDIDPLSDLYSPLLSGILSSNSTHNTNLDLYGGAEGGGCFAAGTQITMADGSTKPIEEIKIGDKILTFDSPTNRKLVSGKVTNTFEHIIKNYLIINNEITITPEHVIFANSKFIEAGDLVIGDRMLDQDGNDYLIKSIDHYSDLIPVYNFTVDPQHTYFAEGLYVHNDKGGIRAKFLDAAFFESIKTDKNGKANVKVKLPDNITSWRITAQALTKDLYAGVSTKNLSVSLPVFNDVTIGKEYLIGEEPEVRMRAFGSDLTARDHVTFKVESDSLAIPSDVNISSPAYTSAYYKLPKLVSGKHKIKYALDSKKGADIVELPMTVLSSRLKSFDIKKEKLKTDYKIKIKDNNNITVTITDLSKSLIYNELLNLRWEYGGRLDQSFVRQEADSILSNSYNNDFGGTEFDSVVYQYEDGGVTLLPYSSSDLELTSKVAAVGANGFDKIAMSKYFYDILDSRSSTVEEVSLSLYGLASLGEPVLPKIGEWMQRDDLSPKSQLYIAQGLSDLGAGQWARKIYKKVISEYGKTEEKANYVYLDYGKSLDERFGITILAGHVAASVNAVERNGLWKYVVETQVLYGEDKNSENLFNLEKLKFIQETIDKPEDAYIEYDFNGITYEVDLSAKSGESFFVTNDTAKSFKINKLTGDVGIILTAEQTLNLATTTKDSSISIAREYYINGKKSNTFNEDDLIEVRLFPKFNDSAISGQYQISDILPSGLTPVVNTYSWNQSYDCNLWSPYLLDGQRVQFSLDRDYLKGYCTSDYIKYFARVKTRGEYKAESAIIQSFKNPELINYSSMTSIIIK